MVSEINDNPQIALFVSAANSIRSEFLEENLLWRDSPFAWILKLAPGSKGKLGKRLISQWCALKGLPITPSPDSEADVEISNHRVEIKFSTLWKDGSYTFQQFRDQNYDYAICLGISPNEVHCWVISKEKLREHVIGHLGQHTGAGGKETSWIHVNPNNPPQWLSESGGNLDDAFRIIHALTR